MFLPHPFCPGVKNAACSPHKPYLTSGPWAGITFPHTHQGPPYTVWGFRKCPPCPVLGMRGPWVRSQDQEVLLESNLGALWDNRSCLPILIRAQGSACVMAQLCVQVLAVNSSPAPGRSQWHMSGLQKVWVCLARRDGQVNRAGIQ